MTALTLLLMLSATETAPAQAAPPRTDVVLKWNDLALRLIRLEKTTPPMVARNLAILHVAMYDAVNAVAGTHQPFLVTTRAQPGTSPDIAAAIAAHRVLTVLYPRQTARCDTLLTRCLAELPGGAAREQGVALGRFVADRVLEWRRRDGADNPGRYTARRQLGIWEPSPPAFQAALLPEWGMVEPFAIRKGTQYRPPAPPPLNSEAYARAFDEVKRLGGKDSRERTPEQTDIALFWADNAGTVTPPGHWNQIAAEVSRRRGLSLAENARLFALLNVSLADAGILCWVLKFTYEFWRPILAIRHADEDGNAATTFDPKWAPLIDTPPFPAYISGHSTFSGAAAAVLADFFGSDAVRFTTTSDGLPDSPRTFAGFWAAAEEAGQSRIYGGIHWQFDNREGLAVGRHLGRYVTRTILRPRPPRERPPIIVPEVSPAPSPTFSPGS